MIAILVRSLLVEQHPALVWLPFIAGTLAVRLLARSNIRLTSPLPSVSEIVTQATGLPIHVQFGMGLASSASPSVLSRGGTIVIGSDLIRRGWPVADFVLWHEVGHLAATGSSLRAINKWVLSYFSGARETKRETDDLFLSFLSRVMTELNRQVFGRLLGPVVRFEELYADEYAARKLGTGPAQRGLAGLVSAINEVNNQSEAEQISVAVERIDAWLNNNALSMDDRDAIGSALESEGHRESHSWYPTWRERETALKEVPILDSNAIPVPWPERSIVGKGLLVAEEEITLFRVGAFDFKAVASGFGLLWLGFVWALPTVSSYVWLSVFVVCWLGLFVGACFYFSWKKARSKPLATLHRDSFFQLLASSADSSALLREAYSLDRAILDAVVYQSDARSHRTEEETTRDQSA